MILDNIRVNKAYLDDTSESESTPVNLQQLVRYLSYRLSQLLFKYVQLILNNDHI